MKDLLLRSVLTGCRISESVQIKWSDIDLEKRQATIRSSEDSTKKTSPARIIPINDTLLAILKRRAKQNNKEVLFHRKGFLLDRVSTTHKFKQLVRSLKLNPEFKFHTLRLTFASWLVQIGVPLYTV